MSLWPKSQVPTTIIPPIYHKPVGRPKKKRKISEVEKDDVQRGGKLSKKNVVGTCGKCKGKGHNSRTCTGAPYEEPKNASKGKTVNHKSASDEGSTMQASRGKQPARAKFVKPRQSKPRAAKYNQQAKMSKGKPAIINLE